MTGPLPSSFRRPVEVTIDPNTTVEIAPGLQVAHHYSMSIDLVVLDNRKPAPAPIPLHEGGQLVSWEPRWEPPVVRSACPSCGRVADRTATNWTGRHGSVRVHLECRGSLLAPTGECWRNWDERVPVPAEPANPELWR